MGKEMERGEVRFPRSAKPGGANTDNRITKKITLPNTIDMMDHQRKMWWDR